MTEELLIKITNTQKEVKDLEKRIISIKSEMEKCVSDSVRGSSKEFPYIEHTCKIEGIKVSKKHKKMLNTYKKMLQHKKEKLIKLNKQFEYELNYIEDSELRIILRLKYTDDLTNNQIAQKMNKESIHKDYTEDGIRMKLKRFFKKI